MIVKVVKREKATSDFEKLGNYILEAQNENDAIMWTRTADYIMDVKGDGEKLAYFNIANCNAQTPAEAIAEILLTQSEQLSSKADKTYHLVISFREGEQVSREQMNAIEESICSGLGFEGHQRLSACHINTENTHLHIAINKVHPKTLRCVEPYYPYLKLDALCKELEVIHGLEKDNRIWNGKRLEAVHTGEQSLLEWTKETVAPLLKDVTQWSDLHTTLAEFGLVIKPRGAGLIIATLDEKLSVKASSVDRSLSSKSLTDKLGDYTHAATNHKIQAPKIQKSFAASNTLYTEYKQQQANVWQVRKDLKQQHNNERQAFMKQLKDWQQAERQRIKSSRLSPKEKQAGYQQIASERQQKLNEFRALQKEARDKTYIQHPIQSWQSFLLKSAEEGNTQALETLRFRKRRQEHIEKALFTTQDIEKAKDIVLKQYKPYARKNGDLVYRVSDGGIVTDEKYHVRVDEKTVGATFLALTIASERFKDQPLEVKGEEPFKRQVVELAVQYGYNVQFSDRTMEAERIQKIEAKQHNKTQSNAQLSQSGQQR